MNNTELCERLLAVQKELDTLEEYVEYHFLVDERVDYRLAARWLLLETLLAPLMNVLMIFIRMDNRKAVARRAFLFQSAHDEHIQPHFARCVAVEVALALGIAPHGKLNQWRCALD